MSARAHVGGELLNLTVELRRVRADVGDELGEGFGGNLLLQRLEFLVGEVFGLVRPIAVVERDRGEVLDRAELLQGFVKRLALVRLAGADKQPHAVPAEGLQLRREFRERLRHRGGRRRAVVTEEAAILEPHDLAAAEERECLERLAEFSECLERLTAVADGGVNCLVVHAADLAAPLVEELPRALLHREVLIAVQEGDGRGRGGLGRCGHRWRK